MALKYMDISPQFKIEKSPLPIVWIDTSIILNMTRLKHNLGSLSSVQKKRISWLYEQLYNLGRSGKILCPLAEQDLEVWAERDKWFDTIHSLSLGIETLPEQGIHDSQLYATMKAYLKNESVVNLSYLDIFESDPVVEIREVLRSPFFVTVEGDIVFGSQYHKNKKIELLEKLNKQRERNVNTRISFRNQLQKERLGLIEALMISFGRYVRNIYDGKDDQVNSVFGVIELGKQLKVYEEISNEEYGLPGLLEFYKSKYYANMPITDLSSNIYAKMMTGKQAIKSGDIMDAKHIYTVMPYSDLFVTDKDKSVFLKRNKFDEKYNTKICYIGDLDIIEGFFGKICD